MDKANQRGAIQDSSSLQDFRQDTEIIQYQDEAQDIVARAEKFQIVDDTTYKKATEIISAIARWKKLIEEKRKSYTKRLREELSERNEEFNSYLEPLNQARKIMDGKIVDYYKRQEKEKPIMEAERTVGTTTIKKIWDFRIIDEAKIPKEFLMVNEPKIREKIREGVRAIEGLEIYQREIVSTR